MKNYQKLRYDRYYIMTEDQQMTLCTREECFAKPEYLPDCPYKQRWVYDWEAGYAVRLPRNQYGDEFGRFSQNKLKKVERIYQKREH